MSDAAARIDAHVAANRDAAIGLLRDLIAAQRGGEAAVQATVAARLAKIGAIVERVRYEPAEVPMRAEFAGASAIDSGTRENVVARLRGRGTGRSLILFAHPDGEAQAGLAAWRHDPFAGTTESGRIHGWGVADDLAGVAIGVLALEAAAASRVELGGDVVLASAPSKRHARGVSALLHGGLHADAALYLHPAESGAGMREIKAFCAGLVEFRVVVTGAAPPTDEPCHTGFAHLGTSALDKALHLRDALVDLDARRASRIAHPALEGAVGRSTNLLIGGLNCGDAATHARVPARCTLTASLSFPPPETLDAVCAEIASAIAAAAAADAWLRAHPPQLEFVSGVTGAETPPEHPLYRTLAAAVVAVTGQAPVVNPMHTSSDIRNPIVQRGIPTLGLGPLCGDLAQNGRHDEWVDAEDYLRAVRVVARAMAAWCAGPGEAAQ